MSTTKLSGDAVLRQVYDEATESLKTNATLVTNLPASQEERHEALPQPQETP